MRFFQYFKAFRNGLHHAVFDSVMDHLQKMAVAAFTGIQVTVLDSHILKQGLNAGEYVAIAPIIATTMMGAFHASGSAGIKIMNALVRQTSARVLESL